MCGVAGVFRVQVSAGRQLQHSASLMGIALTHRGPDDFGEWVDEEAGIAIAHRRLAIVDLTFAGHQPMASGGRFVISFNGEIYNHEHIRKELDESGVMTSWRGHSDTETLLVAFERWGIEATLLRMVGMFAIALWDLREQTLHLIRDRFGEKPLYYGWTGSGETRAFVFASELKALKSYPGFDNCVSRTALAEYMRYMYVPAPLSIYQDIYKLEPGCVLSIKGSPPAAAPREAMRPPVSYAGASMTRWWSLGEVVVNGANHLFKSADEAVVGLEERLVEAVRLQSLADVPLGAFLSGGVDSSTIVALMQQQGSRPVKTFTVGFEEAEFDESPYARAIARQLGTDHTEIFVTAAEARAVITILPSIYDEPFADSSQIPTRLVCAAARAEVTVALSGDAGDEVFGGYNRYFWGPKIWARVAWLPYAIRQTLGKAIAGMPTAAWDALGRPVNALLGSRSAIKHVGDKAHKLAARLNGVQNVDELYMSLVSEWQDPALVVRAEGEPVRPSASSILSDDAPNSGVSESALRMMYRDSMTYLPDDILCKVDRAAMSVSLETRVPFLDHRVVEHAWRMPLDMKIRDGQGKWALRQVLYKYVPREMIDRPKAGFSIPVGQWLCGPLRAWAEALLDEKRLQREGFFYPEPIRRKWVAHLAGNGEHTASIWAVLMFQAWLESVN